MRLIVSRPSGRPIVRDYVEGRPEAVRFYGAHFDEGPAYERKAREVDGRFDRSARERAVRALDVPDAVGPDRIGRFVEEGGYMVTTGQQPGLFGGPLYSLYKGLTAVRLAEALEARLAKPVLPVFWVASDDHDWDEASHTWVIGVDNELHRFDLTAPDAQRTPPLHRVVLGPEVAEVLERFVGHLPQTDFSGEYVELLRAGFAEGTTLSRGFHAVMRAVLGPFGLCFTDAADPALKEGTRSLLLEELDRAEEVEGVLHRTESALDEAGYGLQAKILEGGINLFVEGPAGRERLYRDRDGFRLRTSGGRMDLAEIRAAIDADPSVLSPNVMFRPVVESAFFPTLSYVAGPGEIAYFAELGDYFRCHGIEMPVVYPRWAVTAVESKIGKVLEKFEIRIDDLDRPFHEVAGSIVRDEMPDDVRAAVGKLRGAIGSGSGELQKAVAGIDPTLKGPVQTLRNQSFSLLDDVEKKVVQALKRESEIALQQIEKAQLHLFPNGKPAERIQNPMYYLTRYGSAFLDELSERFTVNLE